ncbi:MAG: SDR family oxidoreductase [Rhodospirillales bacterium]
MSDATATVAGARCVLVTGASSGIGRAAALAFARAGDDVVATGRRADALAALAEAAGGAVRAIAGDVTEAAFVDRLAAAAGPVDVLVNCAGTLRHAPFLDSDPADWQQVIDTNLIALLRLTQAVARGMRDRRRGHVIVVSSILARQVYPYTLVYAATKHAARAVCKGLRLELMPFGVKVTEVAPGIADTAILRAIDHPEVQAAYRARAYPPLAADDVAAAILYAANTDPNACPEVIELNPAGQT